jgi:phosphatidate phosphatase APP1
MLKPYPYVKVRLTFKGQLVYNKTEYDGFFKFEWAAHENVSAGWHSVKIEALDDIGAVLSVGHGQIFVPHITQYAFISDIDDTVMVSHSATFGRRLRELFIRNPRTRKTFSDTYTLYKSLSLSHTNAGQPNPFFYVSSTEWNLYDYLLEIFRFNRLPEGAFLLNQIKRWKDLIRTGKTGHEGKLMRVMRILDAFPNQRFVFLGDNTQRDPEIYTAIAEKYPKNIEAVYIRNIHKEKEVSTREFLKRIEAQHIVTCFFVTNKEAITHAIKTGLINV